MSDTESKPGEGAASEEPSGSDGGRSRIQRLLDLLDVEQVDANIFRGRNPDAPRRRVFGGQVAAQAVMAAGRTVEGRLPHSVHAYFLRPGKPGIPIVYTVDRIRDGGSFNTRRVVAMQNGEAIFNMSASFHKLEDGPSHQVGMPDVPGPEECMSWQELMQRRSKSQGPVAAWMKRRAVEMRPVNPPSFDDEDLDAAQRDASGETEQAFWVRADPMPDDPLMHLCVATHTSDHSLLGAMRRPHGGIPGGAVRFMSASLDHALWFHREFRFDQWLLYAQQSPITAHARGLALGQFYTQDGELVASVCQEGLLRQVEREP